MRLAPLLSMNPCWRALTRVGDLDAQAHQLERCESVPSRGLQGAVFHAPSLTNCTPLHDKFPLPIHQFFRLLAWGVGIHCIWFMSLVFCYYPPPAAIARFDLHP